MRRGRKARKRPPPLLRKPPALPFPTLPAPLSAALAAKGYAEPTPVQEAVLAAETTGRDLLVSAQTGSGKTVAFGLAVAPNLLGDAARLGPPRTPLALVIAPTRELALQVQTELAWLYAGAGADQLKQAARAFCYTVGKNLDALGAEHVRQVRKDCASVILWCAEKATWMAGEGIQIFGGNGYINEYPLGRLWRDAKLYEIGAGTSEIRRMLIGRELFAETM